MPDPKGPIYDAVPHVELLPQLHHLLGPRLVGHKWALVADLGNLLLERRVVHLHHLAAGKDASEKPDKDSEVVVEKFGDNVVAGALHEHALLHLLQRPSLERWSVLQGFSLESTRADEQCLERAQTKILVALPGQSRLTLVKEVHHAARQTLRVDDALTVEHDLRDELAVRYDHGHAAKERMRLSGRLERPA